MIARMHVQVWKLAIGPAKFDGQNLKDCIFLKNIFKYFTKKIDTFYERKILKKIKQKKKIKTEK